MLSSQSSRKVSGTLVDFEGSALLENRIFNCENLVRVVSPCTSAEFQCKDRITCIHRSWVCDGEKDCPGGDDEMAPTCLNVTCRADQFQCKDRTCIAGALECSGKAECADGSDEVNCSEYYCINFPDGVEYLR
uniref:Uncharacterized protein n=1 Tax=Phlebotomus papatasi TaxID=29031 RepID=A0A1B0DC49_PHLPP